MEVNMSEEICKNCKYHYLRNEIERLNNIINELEKYINKLMGQTKTAIAFNKGINDVYETKKYERDNDLFEMVLDKLKELKEENNA